jgi:glycosyltransferase involved in cell wall biosynthesis
MSNIFELNPLVSVLLPCFNAESFIESALNSILNQSYINLDIIVIDDCSHDRTFEIASLISEKDKRVRLFKNSSNLKLIKTLNKGIELSKGEYIARMDADDISMPNRIETQIKYMLLNKNVDICGSNLIFISKDGKRLGVSNYPTNDIDIKMNLLFSNPIAHPTVIYKKHIIHKLGKYNEPFNNIEDYELWLRASNKCIFYNIKEPLLQYRLHDNNISLQGQFVSENLILIEHAIRLNTNLNLNILFPLEFISIHARFVCVGGWKNITDFRLINFSRWKKSLLILYPNQEKKIIKYTSYYCVSAMFTVLKNNKLNSNLVLLKSLIYIILHPAISFRYLINKSINNYNYHV